MVLLVIRKDQRIQHFAAGYRRIIPHHRVDEPGTVFERTVITQHKPHRFDAVKDAAAVSDYSIHELDSFADLRCFVCG